MKKLALGAVGITLLLVAIYHGVGSTLADRYEVSRSIEIAVPPAAVYEYVGHLDRWPEWTVWNAEDAPGLTITHPARTEGVGAVQVWSVAGGEGRLEVTSAEVDRGVSYELTAIDGAQHDGIISFGRRGEVTIVSWQQRGPLEGTRERWFGRMLSGRLERDLARGLERLRGHLEPEEPAPPGDSSEAPTDG